MKNLIDFIEECFSMLCMIAWYLFLCYIPIGLVCMLFTKLGIIENKQNLVAHSIIAVILIILLVYIMKYSKSKEQFKELQSKSKNEIAGLKTEHSSVCEKYKSSIDFQKQINGELTWLLKSKTPFKDVAQMKADFVTCVFKKDEHYMMYKPRPAKTSAEKVAEIRGLFNENLAICTEMLYKYNFLLNTFPELKEYVEDDSSLIQIKNYKNYRDVQESRDAVRDWLSPKEYQMLSTAKRNQLALDRYKRRDKTNWELGTEYEMYIGYLLREGRLLTGKRYLVKQTGIIDRLEDLGRDIIAEGVNADGTRDIYIIQCKRWAKDKIIHENVICQLYGTTVMYEIEHSNFINTRFHAVLVSTAPLSPIAEKFAKKLNIQIIVKPMGDYPMIKCNIDSGIYHLPFDQQYYVTQIKEYKGEFYAFTVEEAERKGYRRAMRHFC